MPSDRGHSALEAIRDNIILAQTFVVGLDQTAFADDRKSVYAVVRCLEIISEASRRISATIKQRHPAIPWDQIAGAGNVYRHDYDNVLEAYVWTTVRDSLPALRAAVEAELSRD